MGKVALGMTVLNFETAVHCNIPILNIVLNNNFMAAETRHMKASHERYQTQALGGNYSEIGRALGGWAERVEDPEQVASAIQRARRATENGKAALLEFVTSREIAYSRVRE